MRPNRAMVAIDKTDRDWIKSTAEQLNVSIIDIIRAMVERHRRGGLTDLARTEDQMALERIRKQKQRLLLEEEKLMKSLGQSPAVSQRRRRIAPVDTYSGEDVLTHDDGRK